MVFVGGPRQVGKTTLAKTLASSFPSSSYLLWDNPRDRKSILKAEWPSQKSLVVLDELHKYLRWKAWIKGQYDKYLDHLRFIVTGSARLDVYRKGGDSLQGRYHYYRLHPFSLGEAQGSSLKQVPFKELVFHEAFRSKDLKDLFQFGGFPEPFFSQSEKEWRRWQKERQERVLREDVRDLEHIKDISLLHVLADLMTARVGSPLSLNALREDLEVSHKAVSHWVEVFEKLYFAFLIRPFAHKKTRSLKKEPKGYLWDWSLVDDEGARFENMIASHLLKLCHFLEDTEGYAMQLFYLRDRDKREVDFLVTCKNKPWFAVEAKLSDEAPSSALSYYRDRLEIPFVYQVTFQGKRDFQKEGIRVMPAETFLAALP